MNYKVWITYVAESCVTVEAPSFDEAEKKAISKVGDLDFEGKYHANTIELMDDWFTRYV